MLERPVWQGTEGSFQSTVGKKLKPWAHRREELNSANNHMNLEMDPASVKPWDDNGPVDTLTAAYQRT